MKIDITTHTVIADDSGKIIKEKDESKSIHQLTALQWNRKHYKLRKNSKGHSEDWYTGRMDRHTGHAEKAGAVFYTDEEVLPMTAREVARYEKKQKEARHQAYVELKWRKEEERKRREEEERIAKETEIGTAWQWLSSEHRVPVDGAECVWKEAYDREWAYYERRDTESVSDERYEQLKALYIQRFGGWEHIDLDNTEYDGRKWW